MAGIFGGITGAIGTVHMSIEAVQFLNRIPQIKDEFQQLCKEIKAIENLVIYARSTIPPGAAYIENRIEEIAQDLTKIAEDLSNIADASKRERGDGTYTVKTGKWLTQSNKIAELLQKAQKAQADLHFVFSLTLPNLSSLLLAVLEQHSTQLSRIEQLSMGTSQGAARLSILSDILHPGSEHTKQQHRVTELPDSWTAADGDDADQRSRDGFREDPPFSADSLSRTDQLQPTRPPSEMMTMFSEMLLNPKCRDGCSCACHARAQQPRKRSWMSDFAASINIQYDMSSWGIQRDPRCQCHGDWNVEFRSLLWLCARTLIVSGNRQILVSLRAPRIIPFSNVYWNSLYRSAQSVKREIVHGGTFYPDDQTESGYDVVMCTIFGFRYDVLELLLAQWRSILPKQGLSKRAAWAASRTIELNRRNLSEMQLRLLQSVVSFSEAGDEPAITSVHEAAKTGLRMAEALAENGWAKDMLDSAGEAPLHWAVLRGHIEATQLLIDGGADVNVENVSKETPLMAAAGIDEADCMRRLLLAGCRIDKVDTFGDTALHLAAWYGLVEPVRLLLGVGPKRIAAAENMNRQRPLHSLTRSHKNGATSEAIERIAGLLLDASPESLESRNGYGNTPLFRALASNNLPLVRYLVRAGASLNVVDYSGYNLLHRVALDSTATTIAFLLEAEQGHAAAQMVRIDHRLPDNDDNTPWVEFMHVVHAPPWALHGRHPYRRTRDAFVKLYRAIRDRNVRHDISALQHTMNALSNHDTVTAQSYLCGLAAHKAEGCQPARANFYRAFSQQIRVGETEAATLGIQEDLDDLVGELDSSPWDQEPSIPVFEGAHWCQWVDFPSTSLWIEPVEAVLGRSPSNIYETEEAQMTMGSESEEKEEEEAFEVDKKVDCDQITRIYCEEGRLLYDRKANLCSPREFLQRYE